MPATRQIAVHIQSYPKTGNTWARFLLGNYFQIVNNSCDTILLEGDREENNRLREFGLPAFFATHAPLLWESQTARDLSYKNVVLPYRRDTIILMIRYPLDAVLSHYMQHHFGRGHETRHKFNSFFEFATDPVFGVEKAIQYYNIWADALDRERIFPLKYEQLRLATLETVRSLLSFLGLPCEKFRPDSGHRAFVIRGNAKDGNERKRAAVPQLGIRDLLDRRPKRAELLFRSARPVSRVPRASR